LPAGPNGPPLPSQPTRRPFVVATESLGVARSRCRDRSSPPPLPTASNQGDPPLVQYPVCRRPPIPSFLPSHRPALPPSPHCPPPTPAPQPQCQSPPMPMVPAATAPSQPRLPRRRNKRNRISVRLRAGVLCVESVHFHPSPRHLSNPHRTVPVFFPSPLSTQRYLRRLRPTAQSLPRTRLVTRRGTPTRGRIRGTTPWMERPGLGLSPATPPPPGGRGGGHPSPPSTIDSPEFAWAPVGGAEKPGGGVFTAQQAGPPPPHPPEGREAGPRAGRWSGTRR